MDVFKLCQESSENILCLFGWAVYSSGRLKGRDTPSTFLQNVFFGFENFKFSAMLISRSVIDIQSTF